MQEVRREENRQEGRNKEDREEDQEVASRSAYRGGRMPPFGLMHEPNEVRYQKLDTRSQKWHTAELLRSALSLPASDLGRTPE